MKVKIERIHLALLRNDEFPVFYGQIIGICGKYDMNRLHLVKSYGELLSFHPTLESLTVYLHKNAKLNLSGKIDVERDALISLVNRVVKGYENIELPEMTQHFSLLNALLEKHHSRTIASDSRAAETQRLQMLENDVNADAAVQNAFAVFGLTPAVTRLFAANREYDDLLRQYVAEKSEEQHINVRQLRKECSKTLTQFFDAVQYSAYVYDDLNYMPLINELVKLNQYYSRQLNARVARRKSGKKTDDEPAIPPMESEESGVN
jgi:hypothetical protein